MRENTDLIQIRPAFGANIMAQIITENSRPQFVTVRYKVMDRAQKINTGGKLVVCELSEDKRKSAIQIDEIIEKDREVDISEADVLVVAGNGVKDDKGLELCEHLALSIGGMLLLHAQSLKEGAIVTFIK